MSLSTSKSLLLIGFFVAGCSRIQSTGPDPECSCAAPLAVTLAVQGTELDELLSLDVVLQDVRLLRSTDAADGSDSTDILRAPRQLDVLALADEAQTLATGYYLAGTFDRLLVEFGEGAPRARALSGAEFDVESVEDRIQVVELDEPIVLMEGEVESLALLITVEADESLRRVEPDGPFTFAPRVRARTLQENEGVIAQAIRGRAVTLVNEDRGIGVLTGRGALHDHNEVFVEAGLTDDTRFFDEDNQELTGRPAFLRRLAEESHRVVLRGTTVGSSGLFGPRVVASSVQLEWATASPPPAIPIIGVGRVVGSLPGGALSVRITAIEQNPVSGNALLQGLGIPATLELQPGIATLYTDRDGGILGPDEIVVGARVRVTLENATIPAVARRVVVVSPPAHRGFLVELSTSGDPLRITLRPGDAAIEAGLVASATTDVTVDLANAFVVLDVLGSPVIPLASIPPGLAADEAAGMWVKAFGPVTGTPSEPVIFAERFVVRPGRFDGAVMGTSPTEGRFQCSIETFSAPFGGTALSPPLTAVVAPNCTFQGDASTAAEFYALYDMLGPGTSLKVRASGIRGPFADEVIAFEIRAMVQ